MRGLLSKGMALPLPGKAMIGMVLAGGVYGIFTLLGMPQLGFMLGIVLAALTFVLAIFAFGMEKRDKKKAANVEANIADSAAATPAGVNKVADRAKLDDLRKQFEGGVQTFKDHGKNLYDMPWYVVVGEPGSGKTEAVRHSGIGFPPGLQDQLQGTGGTVNMNWWFTDQAVVLDTAGRLMFEDVAPGENNEWREFLKLLRTSRPNCPINGVLLVIPADTLITDSTDEIEKKASKIAQQFDQIQRSLGVRFPVFVLISKSDLINGFREFFEDITDPRLTAQMLGWANPADLDEPFRPDRVEEHLETVRDHLLQRRFSLLQDPIHNEDPKGRRIDQVDALYKFPEAITEIGPRLRRYLETIFVAGEWSQKPLFLRGIFFTSSMRDGAALDADLAEALGVGVGALSEGKLWERERSYFLRDMFLDKVFKERGLVTRAANAGQVKRKRTMLMVGTAAAASLFLGAMIWYSYSQTKAKIQNPRDFWVQVQSAVDEVAADADESNGLTKVGAVQKYLSPLDVNPSVLSDRKLVYNEPFESGNADVRIDGTKQTYYEVFERAKRYYEENRSSSGLFALVAALPGGGKDVFKRQLPTQRLLFDQLVLSNAVDLTRTDILEDGKNRAAEIGWGASDLGPSALASLISIEVGATTGKGQPIGRDGFQNLVEFAVASSQDASSQDAGSESESSAENTGDGGLGQLVEYYEWLYPDDTTWPPETLAPGSENAVNAITRGIEAYNTRWRNPRGEGTLYGQLLDLQEAGTRLSAAEKLLADTSTEFDKVDTEKAYQTLRDRWIQAYDDYGSSYELFAAAVDGMGSRLSGDGFNSALAEEARLAVWNSAKESYDALIVQFGDEKAREKLKEDKEPEKQLIEWRTVLVDAKNVAETSYREKAAELVAYIRETIVPEHLAMSGRFRAFKARAGIYDGVKQALDLGVPGEAGLRAQMDSIDQDLDAQVKPINVDEDRFGNAAVAAYSAAARHRRYLGLHSEVTRLQGWKEILSAGEAASLPLIPLTQLGTLNYQTKFIPEKNKSLFESFSEIGSRVAASDDQMSGTLDRDEIKQRIMDVEMELSAHLAEYERFWAEEVPLALEVRSDGSWKSMRATLVDAHRRADAIGELRDLMTEAVSHAGSDSDRPKVVSLLAQAVAAEEEDGTLRDRIQKSLIPSWSRLDQQAATAGNTLERAAKQIPAFMQAYFPLESGSEIVGPEELYWRSFAVAAIEKIATEAAGAEQQEIMRVIGDCKRFPVTLDADAGSGLTQAEIESVHRVLSGIGVLTSGASIEAGDDPYYEVTNSRIHDALINLRGGSLENNPSRVERLRAALDVTAFLTENQRRITFTLAVQNTDFPENASAGTNWVDQVSIEKKMSVEDVLGGYSLFQGREVFSNNYNWTLPLSETVNMNFSDGRRNDIGATLRGWEPLKALAYSNETFGSGETVWKLPIRLENGKEFWMGAVFSGEAAGDLSAMERQWLRKKDW